jgi:TetR/AcrR family transcriptional regulator
MDVPQQILEASTRLMAERGFEGTSLSAIADAVGVRKATLLYHFPSKETLRLAVLDRLLSHWNEALPGLLRLAARTGTDRFEALVAELVDFFSADPARPRLLLREMLDRPEEMRDYLQRAVRPWIGLIADQVRQGQRAGAIRADVDPEAYVLNVVGLALANLSTVRPLGVLLAAPEHAGAHDDHRARYVEELVRIARTSLFVTRAPDARAERQSTPEPRSDSVTEHDSPLRESTPKPPDDRDHEAVR